MYTTLLLFFFFYHNGETHFLHKEEKKRSQNNTVEFTWLMWWCVGWFSALFSGNVLFSESGDVKQTTITEVSWHRIWAQFRTDGKAPSSCNVPRSCASKRDSILGKEKSTFTICNLNIAPSFFTTNRQICKRLDKVHIYQQIVWWLKVVVTLFFFYWYFLYKCILFTCRDQPLKIGSDCFECATFLIKTKFKSISVNATTLMWKLF